MAVDGRGRSNRGVALKNKVLDLDEEQDPDPHLSEKMYPDPQ